MAQQVPMSSGGIRSNGISPPYQMFNSASLYVGNLLPDVTEAMLYEVFNSVGPVASIRVCRDNATRKSLGYAYVNYYTVQDAEAALESLNYIEIRGQPTRIMWSNRDPTLRKSGTGNIFVKNLDKQIDTKALYDTFIHFGAILSCKVATDLNGRSKGFGFVHYDKEESAREAIEKVNGMLIGSEKVSVAPFLRRTERTETFDEVFTNLYVRNFPESFTEDDLKELFSPYGEITSMMIKSDDKGRKFAFINFADTKMARSALDGLNGTRVQDNIEPLLVCQHQGKARRQAMLRAQFGSNAQEQRQKNFGVNLYIKNIEDSIGDEELRDIFSQYGTVTSAKVMRDASGVSRGFGFVCFSKLEEATKAVAGTHLKLVKNKPLYVGLAEKREQRLSRLQQRNRPEHFVDRLLPQQQQQQQQVHPAGPPQQQQPSYIPMYPEMGMYYNPQVQYRPQIPQVPGARGMRMYAPLVYGQAKANPPPAAAANQNPNGTNRPRRPQEQHMPVSGFKFTSQARNKTDVVAQGIPQQTIPPQVAMAPNIAKNPAIQKQMIGERLFPIVARDNPELAGKITGMMLEMDNLELLTLLENETQLHAKIQEAIRVLQQAQ
ncbi:bifunctional Nucleotide-binding alpha-beta plait domain superfamily/RNA recognition motif domain/Polyadenylate-binding protein-Hyperplastic disc protein/RNA-binding domain superfamily/PABP [Babesia duncani]|uniref:Polyadenylate-binding protein n=1 Tax=Babesia duncani TaxID=323732 RepID=A0AAD9UPG8_9APIC|nr:bifunctional Nucleotide-binding alpha-beta plait domain superfamily/RNA recognition motif domain/Polyadenylate-binding protein-Hyperplastic disc protein/RNA-binding domain superfamily/PABP [Babesia duncani]